MAHKFSETIPTASGDHDKKVILFFVLTYVFTWICHLAIPVFGLSFSFDMANPSMYLYLIGILGPLVSAIIVSAQYEGSRGVKKLLSGALKWRFSPIWYLFAIFIVALLQFVSIGIHIRAVPKPLEWMSFPLMLIYGQLWIVLGEEYGWRGFALPRLQSRLGPLGAGLVLGVLWAGWHLPMFFIPGSPQFTESFFTRFPLYVLIVTCWSIIMTMLYNRAGVLACMIFHAALNIAAFTIQMPRGVINPLYLYIPVVLLSIFLMPRPLFALKSAELEE